MKVISILGSTGSIGTQTLSVVREHADIQVAALAAYGSIGLLEEQIREFKPKLACVYDEKKAAELKLLTRDLPVRIVSGMDGLTACAVLAEAEMVVGAVVGMIGIQPVIEAIKSSKNIALANKETLAAAGHIIMPLVKKYQVDLLPVDSEHSAIFQCLQGRIPYGAYQDCISRIILTASGGPFRGKKREELKEATVEDALRHPNWKMGKKISVDSATMVNKGLELIEARWLFGLPADSIEVVIQPQSLIHSAVEFHDGSILAQMGTPDMRIPIQYALFYPERRYLRGERIDFSKLSQITFEKPDLRDIKGLSLAMEAVRAGGSMPAVYNSANEMAVSLFLDRKIPFLGITDLIEAAMARHAVIAEPSLPDILNVEQETYDFIKTII